MCFIFPEPGLANIKHCIVAERRSVEQQQARS